MSWKKECYKLANERGIEIEVKRSCYDGRQIGEIEIFPPKGKVFEAECHSLITGNGDGWNADEMWKSVYHDLKSTTINEED